MHLTIDSTIISVPKNLSKNGYKTASRGDKILIKFTVVFNGEIPTIACCFTDGTHNSENVALRDVILSIKDIEKSIENAEKINFIFDRGLQKRSVYDEMTDKGIYFVGRIQPNPRIMIVKVVLSNGGKKIKKEVLGYLYGGGGKKSKHLYRVVIFSPGDTKEDIVVATNIPETDMSAQEVAELYRKRWDIEVFFRFIKQTLDFSHLVNRTENGIMSMMYIKLICAILLIAFRKLNNIKGYKDAKRALSLVILKEMAKLVNQRGPPLK